MSEFAVSLYKITTCKNPLHFYTLRLNNPKRKLGKQFNFNTIKTKNKTKKLMNKPNQQVEKLVD